MNRWLDMHSLRHHVLAPLWLRIPEKKRWRIVGWLNRSQRRCWSDLVSDALATPEDDSCNVSVPQLIARTAPDCASSCYWSHPEHVGEHDCCCYCGKFTFTATDGVLDRKASALSSLSAAGDLSNQENQ